MDAQSLMTAQDVRPVCFSYRIFVHYLGKEGKNFWERAIMIILHPNISSLIIL
jgi:hypothetical protein